MRAAARIALLTVLGLFVFAACDTGVNGGGNDDDDNTPTAVAPVISPTTENHTDSVSVTMTTTTPNATIRYTVNGSNPTSSDEAYEGVPIPISGAGPYTVRAIAQAPGYIDSPVASRTYTITASQPGTILAPAFFDVSDDEPMASATYLGSVTLRGEVEAIYHRIYYTLDNSDPSYSKPNPFGAEVVNGEQLVSNLTIDRPLTFKAIAVDTGATPPVVSEIVELDIGIKLLPPVVEYETSLNTWANLDDGDSAILNFDQSGLRVYYNGTYRPAHLTVGDEIAFHYTLDGTTPTDESEILDSLAEFMPAEDNPANQLKVFCRRYVEGSDTYVDSDVVTIDYRRRVPAVVLDRNPADSSADRPIELTMTSELSGAVIQYRYNEDSSWLTYDAANKPYIFPNFATDVSIRSEKADWASWEGGTVATLDAEGLVYLETSGGAANPKVYIYRSDGADVEITGFDYTPVKIASWNGALYYIDDAGQAIYRHDPVGIDPVLANVDQIPGTGNITFVTADNVEYPGQTFYYLTFDGVSEYRIWEYVANGTDVEYMGFSPNVGMGTSGFWIDDNSDQDYHVNSGDIDTTGSVDLQSRVDITPDPRMAFDLTTLAGAWVYRDGDGDLRFLVAGTDGTDNLVPNVDHGGSISSITGR